MRLLLQFARANVMLTLEYRAGFLVYMLNIVAGPTIALLVWLAVQSHAVQALPLDRSQLVTYFILMAVVSMLTDTWIGFYVAADIRSGDLAKFLMWPAPPMAHGIGNNAGEKIVKLVLLLPLVVLVGFVFRDDIRLPLDPARWLLFLVALVLAAALNFLLDYLIGSLAFFVQDVSGIATLNRLVEGLLAGRFVPLVLFPTALTPLLDVQPWRFLLSFPLEILTLDLSPGAVARGLALQLGYLAALALAHRILWRRGLRAFAATGR
jgi:ABC-2 type transport system permease protein